MEIVAKSIRSHDEEHLKPLAIPLVDTPVADFHTFALEFRSRRVDVAYEDGSTLLRAIAPIDRETDAHAVPFHDDGGVWFELAFHFDQREMFRIPLRCGVQIAHR